MSELQVLIIVLLMVFITGMAFILGVLTLIETYELIMAWRQNRKHRR